MDTRRLTLVVAIGALAVAATAPGSQATGAQVLARLPSELVAQIPQPTVEGLLDGSIPADEFLASLGQAADPRALAPTELQEKQYITHWLYHYTCLRAAIAEDVIGEASISGRCSGERLTDDPDAPSMSASYWSNREISTSYYSAPSDSATCTTDNTDLTRYFVTWVKSPSARTVTVWIGASDYFKFWVNGAIVSSRVTGGSKAFAVDEFKAPVTLAAGWNRLVFRHTFPQLGPGTDPNQDVKHKYFSVRFVTDSAGTPVTDLVAAFDPTCDEADINKATYTRVIVPTIAHLSGVGGSQWRTDVTIHNGYHMRWQFRLRYFREGVNSGTPNAEKFIELAPFETKVYSDALAASLFGVTGNEKGYFWLLQGYYNELAYGGWLQAKMYNQGSAGTFGMIVPALYAYQGTSWAGIFYGLRNGAYRTNFGMAPGQNAGATASIRLTLFGSDLGGAVVQKDFSGITGFWQLNNVFAEMGQGGLTTNNTSLYFEFLSDPTNTYWYPYVTINDGNPTAGITGTSDPTMFVPAYWQAWPPELN